MKARTARTRGYIDYDSNLGTFAVEGNLTVSGTSTVTGATVNTGTLTGSTGLVATTGGVTASAGNIVATLGNITAAAGSVAATLGAVTAGTTVTGATGLRATTGGVVSSAGGLTVTAGSSGIAVNGTDACNFTSGNGALLSLKVKTAAITITAVDTDHTEASWIPAGALVVGVVGRVTTTITGAVANISVGYTAAATAFCNAKGSKLAAGTTFNSYTEGAATGPILFPAAADLIITSSSGNFSGGVMRVTAFYYDLTAPTS